MTMRQQHNTGGRSGAPGQREQRRRQILAAARAQLDQAGYHGINMRDLATTAGVSPAALYSYFAGKDELFLTLYAERVDRFHGEIAPICAAATCPERLFVAIAGRYLDVYRSYGRYLDLWSLLHAEPEPGGGGPPHGPLIEATGRVLATVKGAFGRLAAERDAQFADDELVVPFLWATLNGLADQFSGERHLLHPYAWDEMIAFAAATLFAGVERHATAAGRDR